MTPTDTIPAAETAARLVPMADGLDVLIRFHDREVDTALLGAFQRHDVGAGLIELVKSDDAQKDVQTLIAALDQLGATPTTAVLDDLAVDYADLFLTHGYRVSPSGSVWLTEDKLERQIPMFDVRDWYDHYDISVPDWRMRADDHLVHELQFVSFLCRKGGQVAAQDAGRFLDLHVLPWAPEFCRRAEHRVRQPLYRAVMRLTLSYLQELRTELQAITGLPRDVRDIGSLDTQRQPEPEVAAYLPGATASW